MTLADIGTMTVREAKWPSDRRQSLSEDCYSGRLSLLSCPPNHYQDLSCISLRLVLVKVCLCVFVCACAIRNCLCSGILSRKHAASHKTLNTHTFIVCVSVSFILFLSTLSEVCFMIDL